VILLLAWFISRFSYHLAGLVLRLAGYKIAGPETMITAAESGAPYGKSDIERRGDTLQQLVASLITISVFTSATILALSQFISLTNLAVAVTIFSTAFGFAARDYIGDFLNGFSNIFENRFAVGENVAVFRVGDVVEGIAEQVTIRTLSVRTRTGDLIIVPHGEVRILRNYSRGSFTGTTVTCRIATHDLADAVELLIKLGNEAPILIPDLLSPWVVLSQEGSLGKTSDILIHAKARYGHGAEVRLQAMTLIEDRLAAAGISLAG
jgi:small conductance mechanosensitive channel